MATVNGKSLRDEFEAARADVEALRAAGKLSGEVDAVIRVLMTLLSILISILLERTTPKTSRNSGIPPSQMDDKDETAARSRRRANAKEPGHETGANLRKVTTRETITVETCEACGADLSGVTPTAHERRISFDIIFEVVEHKVDAEIKDCPECRARTRGQFPDTMPGPRQYGIGFMAFIINLLVAHMLSLRRTVALVQAISGLKISEATCLNYIRRLHDALEAWEQAAIERLLTRPALHADETGMRVDGKNHWLHIITDGSLTLKFLHRKRGAEAIDDIGIIPRFTGTLIHDCWASYFSYDKCRHGLCGAHLLRELAFMYRVQRLPLGTPDEETAVRGLPQGQHKRNQDPGAKPNTSPSASDTEPSLHGEPGNCPKSPSARKASADASQSPMPTTCTSGSRNTKTPCCASYTTPMSALRTMREKGASGWQRSR